MTDADGCTDRGDDRDGPSPRVAAAAIRDAIEALQVERPDIAGRLWALLGDLEDLVECVDEERSTKSKRGGRV
jgi:hypothetical protein